MGAMCYYPGYWALLTKLLNARVAAAACGLITIANLGGFVGPYAIGFLNDHTGTQLAGVLLLVRQHHPRRQRPRLPAHPLNVAP